MAEKGFGVKEVNLIGASGTPTITSPNNLNLNANNVAISTNVSIGGTLSVTGNVSVGGTLTYEDVTNIDSVGVVTARSGLSVTGGTSFFAGAISAAGGITGTATTATNITVTANNTANETVYPLFSDGASGSQGAETDTNLTYNPSSNLLTAGSFSGSLAASNLTGTIADGRFPSTLPAISGANLTNLNGSNISSGTVADARISTLTASKLSGALPAISGANLTNLPEPDEAPVVDFTVTANGSSAYRFSGGGVDSTADDPDLYLIRGQKYRFNNTTGSNHPFQFRLTTGGSAYTDGITGDQNGVQFFTPALDAPSKLYYVCTLHSNMVGTIYLRGAGGNNENVGVTTFSGTVHANETGDAKGIRIHSNGGISATNNELRFNTSQSNGFTFKTNSDGSSSNEVLRISSSGRIGVVDSNLNSRITLGYDSNNSGDAFMEFRGPHNKSGEMLHKYIHNGASASSNIVNILQIGSWQSANSHIFGVVTVMGVSPVSAFGFQVRGYFYAERGSSNTNTTGGQTGSMAVIEGTGTGGSAQGSLSWSGNTLRYSTPSVAYLNMHLSLEYHTYDGATVSLDSSSRSF